ncbi:hypothetical protein LguiA_016375 [Lonicera macranthoides]
MYISIIFRKVGKRKAPIKEDKSSKSKAAKKGKLVLKDPNKPKRPPSAFFVFLEEFRKSFKKENPNVKAVSAVGKAGGEKWKSMSAAEKAPYEAKAAKRKVDYEKLMKAYDKKQASIFYLYSGFIAKSSKVVLLGSFFVLQFFC